MQNTKRITHTVHPGARMLPTDAGCAWHAKRVSHFQVDFGNINRASHFQVSSGNIKRAYHFQVDFGNIKLRDICQDLPFALCKLSCSDLNPGAFPHMFLLNRLQKQADFKLDTSDRMFPGQDRNAKASRSCIAVMLVILD